MWKCIRVYDECTHVIFRLVFPPSPPTGSSRENALGAGKALRLGALRHRETQALKSGICGNAGEHPLHRQLSIQNATRGSGHWFLPLPAPRPSCCWELPPSLSLSPWILWITPSRQAGPGGRDGRGKTRGSQRSHAGQAQPGSDTRTCGPNRNPGDAQRESLP